MSAHTEYVILLVEERRIYYVCISILVGSVLPSFEMCRYRFHLLISIGIANRIIGSYLGCCQGDIVQFLRIVIGRTRTSISSRGEKVVPFEGKFHMEDKKIAYITNMSQLRFEPRPSLCDLRTTKNFILPPDDRPLT